MCPSYRVVTLCHDRVAIVRIEHAIHPRTLIIEYRICVHSTILKNWYNSKENKSLMNGCRFSERSTRVPEVYYDIFFPLKQYQ